MKKILWLMALLAIILFTVSCKKKYTYIEIIKIVGEKGETEKEPKTIKASNDSIAYLEAYKQYCIGLKVYGEMMKSGGAYSMPVSFKLLNESGKDISKSVQFVSKKDQEEMLFNLICSLDSNNSNKGQGTTSVRIDSVKIKELENYFKIEKDEFSNNDLKWYKPKSAPQYINRNGIYCYFQTENYNTPRKLDHWLS